MQHPYEIYFNSEREDFEADPLYVSVYDMLSDDWRDRMYAETSQLVTRLERLFDIIERYGEDFEPLSPLKLLKRQAMTMMEYLIVLKSRNTEEHFFGKDLNGRIIALMRRQLASDTPNYLSWDEVADE